MRNLLLGFTLLAVGSGALFAQVSIDAATVGNAASYLPAGLPNSGIAQGAMFIVKGKSLGNVGVFLGDHPRPKSIQGTSMKVTIGGVTKDVLMVYVVGTGKTDQLAGVIPSDTPTGSGTLTVTAPGGSATAPITIVANAFGMFTINQAGSGPAIVQNYYSATDYRLNTRLESLRPGQAGILWGTGLGAIAGDDAAVPTVTDLRSKYNVKMYVGGKEASLFYAGRSSQFSGVDQVNFFVPDGVDGCGVPIAVVVNDVVSNYGSISVAQNNGACSDPVGFSNADLDLAQRNGSFRLGAVSLSRISLSMDLGGITLPPGFSTDIKMDNGSASFLKYLPANLISTSGQMGFTTIGSCVVSFDSGSSSTPVDPVQPDGLDAGPSIRVTGPKGAKDMTPTVGTKGYYSAQLSGGSNPLSGTPYLDPGSYTIAGTGGADVGAFNVTLNLPAALTWANQSAITTVTRAQGVRVTWTGGDPASYVSIIGTSSGPNSKPTATFYCLERVSAGQFTVPPAVLLALPPTPPSSGSDMGGMLMVGSSGQYGTFTATGLDKGYVVASSVSGKTVTYK